MRILEAKPLDRFQLSLKFDNGVEGRVDLSDFAGRGVFQAWLQPGLFEQVSISETGALEWPGELDLCPDAMYLRMTGQSAAEVFPALHNSLTHA